MTKALATLHDATYGGVYYSANIDFTNTGVQPTWTRYSTTGLANTLVKAMRNDVYDPYTHIYLQLDNNNIYHWNGSSWDLIMSEATAATLIGTAGTDFGYISIDTATPGTIYFPVSKDVTYVKLLRSVDYGANWTVVNIVGGLIIGVPNVQAHGQNVIVSYAAPYARHAFSTNGGANWSVVLGGVTSYPFRQDTMNPGRAYGHFSSTSYALCLYQSTGLTAIQGSYILGSNYQDRHWVDPLVDGHHRILRNYNNEIMLFATTDSWATFVDSTPPVLYSGAQIFGALHAARENDSYIMYGWQHSSGGAGVHKVYAINGETSATTWGIAGTNYATPPYTDAIPAVASSYITNQGIYVGEAPSSKGVYVYADEFGSSITTLTSEPVTPLPGDRGSWFDLDADTDDSAVPFSYYHAEDIAIGTPQRHNVWPVSNGNIQVSDGNKWVETTPAAFGIHNAVTLDADAAVILDLSTQEIGLDVQNANTVFAGPTTGVANEPTFRALVEADISGLLELDDLTDVDTTGLDTADILVFDGANWVDRRQNIRIVTTLTTGSYTLNDTYQIVICDASGGNIAITLPIAAVNDGLEYTIKRIDSSANTVTISAADTTLTDSDGETLTDSDGEILTDSDGVIEAIDGEASMTLSQYDAMRIVADGDAGDWWIL